MKNQTDRDSKTSFLLTLFPFASSEWQAHSFMRGLTVLVAVVFAFLSMAFAANGAFSYLASRSYAASAVEIALGFAFGLIAIIAGFLHWKVYRWGYELREEPIETRSEPDKSGRWHELYPQEEELACGVPGAVPDRSREDALAGAARRYSDEFFYNALVNPRSVFARISEYVYPGRKMLDCEVYYEVSPPRKRGLTFYGINDLAVSKACDEAVSCFLTVPLSFHRRGDLGIKLSVTNSSGAALPTVKQRDVTEHIIEIIEGYDFSGRPLKEDPEWINTLRPRFCDYLNNQKENVDTDPVDKMYSFMASRMISSDDRRFAEGMCYMLAGFKSVVPVCVSLHIAVLPAKAQGDEARLDLFPQRVFGLRLKEKQETEWKPMRILPEQGSGGPRYMVNRLFSRFGKRSDTVYYNIARAGRSTSYHLYLEGPEGTYYARGSLLAQDPRDKRVAHAEQVEMQKRYGQRHAHIYINNGHLMSNVSFMFRYKKVPLDSYHIAFVAAFLCFAVLMVSAVTSISGIGDESALGSSSSVPAMILAVATAAGPWLYNRLSEGRGESLGVELAAIVVTVCSGLGIVLFFSVSQAGIGVAAAARFWGLLVAAMATDAAFVGYVAILHSSLYRYLVDKPLAKVHGSDGSCPSRPRKIEASAEGIRYDTPQGRVSRNAYSLWTEALKDHRESHFMVYQGKEDDNV